MYPVQVSRGHLCDHALKPAHGHSSRRTCHHTKERRHPARLFLRAFCLCDLGFFTALHEGAGTYLSGRDHRPSRDLVAADCRDRSWSSWAEPLTSDAPCAHRGCWAWRLLTAALISVNWGFYVWAIGAGHALDAALGYYINPLFSIFLGAVLLKERLSTAHKWPRLRWWRWRWWC